MPRGFPPSRIRLWTQTAHELAERDATVDVAFVVAYSAWEALQCRILAVALFRQGFSMSVAHDYLGRSDLNDRKMVKSQFAAILGRPPQQTSGLSAHWNTLDAWTSHRNALVHGLSTYAPDVLRAGVAEFAERLGDPSWLAGVRVPRELGGSVQDWIPLGDVLEPQRGGRRNGLTSTDLARVVRAMKPG